MKWCMGVAAVEMDRAAGAAEEREASSPLTPSADRARVLRLLLHMRMNHEPLNPKPCLNPMMPACVSGVERENRNGIRTFAFHWPKSTWLASTCHKAALRLFCPYNCTPCLE